MIPIDLKTLNKSYPKFTFNSEASVILTNEELLGVFMFKMIGNVTVFKKNNLFFYLNNRIGCLFSKYYHTNWDSLRNCKPIKVSYVREHESR